MSDPPPPKLRYAAVESKAKRPIWVPKSRTEPGSCLSIMMMMMMIRACVCVTE